MKYLKPIALLSVVIFLFSSCGSSAMRMVCKPGSKKLGCATFRGASDFVAGSNKTLSDDKSSSGCSVGLINKADQAVDVYLDTIWQGKLEPESKGYVIIDKERYNYIHAISYDGQYKWVAQGDCDRKRTFLVDTK